MPPALRTDSFDTPLIWLCLLCLSTWLKSCYGNVSVEITELNHSVILMFILTTCVRLAKMNKIDPFSVQCILSRRLSWSERPQQMKLSSLSQLPCKIMAVLLHFFFLCAFAWMLVEGLHLYSMVIKVFGSEDSKHFYYYAIGWGEYILQVLSAMCGECSRSPQSAILYWHSMASLIHDSTH